MTALLNQKATTAAMLNVATRPRPTPDITSFAGSQWPTSEEDGGHRLNLFPPSHRLIVTTTRGVYAWDMDGVIELFRSESEGIVAAKKLTGNGEMLAVADSQVVILHDINKGMQKSYRLKGTEGQVRLLKYAGNMSSKNLFFTTTLRNSVQTFSLTHAEMLDPSDSHPSPPSVFAISCTSHLLLSTSASPPTIYLRELGKSVPPVLLRPRCSSSAVTAAEFHPEAANVFVLAFADGAAAVYDASLIVRDTGIGGRIDRSASLAARGETASIKGLHTVTSKTVKQSGDDGRRITDFEGTSIQAQLSNITAVALVPGHRATAITIGADGKCCVVDFTQSTRTKAVLLRSWHLRRPATSLSVVYSRVPTRSCTMDRVNDEIGSANSDYHIAVGRQDGKVLLFDLDGKALGKRILDPKGASIIDVEWVKKENDAASTQARPSMPDSWKNVPKRKSLSTEARKESFKENESRAVQRENLKDVSHTLFNFPKDYFTNPEVSSKSFNHLDLPQAGCLEAETRIGEHKMTSNPRLNSDGSFLTHVTPNDSNPLISDPSDSPPPVPPRPTPKPGGKLSQRRFVASCQPQAQTDGIKPRILINDRGNTFKDASPTKLPGPTISPAKGTVPSPRSSLNILAENRKQVPGDLPECVPLQTTNNLPQDSNIHIQIQPHKISPAPPALLEAGAGRVELPIAFNPRSPPKACPPSRLPEPSTNRSSSTSPQRYKSASSHFGISENSIDTVVDWLIESASHRLEPSTQGLSPVRTGTDRSIYRGSTIEVTAIEEKNEAKKETHESINTLAQTSPSLLSYVQTQPQDNALKEANSQRPKLRKSPRIPDINAGVVSATASILEVGGFMDISPSEKVQQEVTSLPDPPSPQRSPCSKKDRNTRSRLPLKISRSVTNLNGEDFTHLCPCEPRMQAFIAASLDTFRLEIAHGFEAQRLWLEDLAKAMRSGQVRSEEEEKKNRLLRAEVARLEKEKAKEPN